jgi:hypothetical protein
MVAAAHPRSRIYANAFLSREGIMHVDDGDHQSRDVSTHRSQCAQSARAGSGTLRRGTAIQQLLQPKLAPRRLPRALRGALDTESGMLLRHDVVLVVGVERLVLWRDVNVLCRQPGPGKVLEQVTVVAAVVVQVREDRVSGLTRVSLHRHADINWCHYHPGSM